MQAHMLAHAYTRICPCVFAHGCACQRASLHTGTPACTPAYAHWGNCTCTHTSICAHCARVCTHACMATPRYKSQIPSWAPAAIYLVACLCPHQCSMAQFCSFMWVPGRRSVTHMCTCMCAKTRLTAHVNVHALADTLYTRTPRQMGQHALGCTRAPMYACRAHARTHACIHMCVQASSLHARTHVRTGLHTCISNHTVADVYAQVHANKQAQHRHNGVETQTMQNTLAHACAPFRAGLNR